MRLEGERCRKLSTRSTSMPVKLNPKWWRLIRFPHAQRETIFNSQLKSTDTIVHACLVVCTLNVRRKSLTIRYIRLNEWHHTVWRQKRCYDGMHEDIYPIYCIYSSVINIKKIWYHYLRHAEQIPSIRPFIDRHVDLFFPTSEVLLLVLSLND